MLLRASTVLLLSAALLNPALSASGVKSCALTEQQFETAINTLRDWQRIHAFHKAHFPQCPDDGYFAEGYSELIVRTLATNWSSLSELRDAAQGDPMFKAFVIRHIDATTNKADLKYIVVSANIRCPKGNVALCANIREAASLALNEFK